MKTKELISILKETDPSGELEVFTEYGDITEIIPYPGYYDGYMHTFITDEKESKAYVKYYHGTKIILHSNSIDDLIGYYDVEVDYGPMHEHQIQTRQKNLEKRKDKHQKIENRIYVRYLSSWIIDKLSLEDERYHIYYTAEVFLAENKLPAPPKCVDYTRMSIVERYQWLFDRCLNVDYDGRVVTISFKDVSKWQF